jgi:hypothetical protein
VPVIPVTGANGPTGSEITRRLGRAMVRKPENAGRLPKQGAEVVLGDFADVECLGAAMTAAAKRGHRKTGTQYLFGRTVGGLPDPAARPTAPAPPRAP